MKTYSEIKEDLCNAIVFMQGNLDSFHYSDKDKEDIEDCMEGLQQALNTIDELLIDGTLEDKLNK